ncbi:fimbrial protein [Burkholderia contaminans]|uniref:fimbrial protein n=1 Tax=Burkholderia contaminans TaxID=488447 RepID=UPI0014538831|nr:fimbrial protein [Burkholderia contaminans]MCA8157744.1 hypothetical protein [Burkholderia contaminans]VWD55062.1 type-1 fimbrial protein subunit A [Burkholderia contaminans]
MKMTVQLSRNSHLQKTDTHPSNLKKALYFSIGMATIFWSMNTQAAATCSGGGITSTISMPATLSVPRDAVAGANLTGWILGTAVTSTFKCNTSRTNSAGVGVMYGGSGTYTGIRIAGPSGEAESAPVFSTNIRGIGLAVAARVYANTCGWQSWVPINKPVDPYIITKASCNGIIQANGVQVAFAYVKLNDPVSVGGYITSENALNAYAQHVGNQLGGTWSPNYYQNSSTLIIPQTCSTPNVTVDMGTVRTDSFTGVGSKSALKVANISLLNCPSGIKTVSYQIDPVTPVLDATNSVVALAPPSATGVGLQLTDLYRVPLQFGKALPFTNYSSSGGNFSIPMLAFYYQTGSVVTPGQANTFVVFTMTYQ